MSELYWHNFATDKTDYREAPETDEEAVKYIPQDPASQGIYRCHRSMGKSVTEAALEVLLANQRAFEKAK